MNRSLRQSLAAARVHDSLAIDSDNRLSLEQQVAQLGQEVDELTERLAVADDEACALVKLVVTARRFDHCADRGEVLEAIADIVINVIGSEDFVVLALDPARTTLWPILGKGATGSACGPVQASDPLVSSVLATGRASGATSSAGGGDDDDDDDAVVCRVPLRAGASVAAVLVLFSLLAHRSELRGVDDDLLEYLSVHAVTALQLADLRASGTLQTLSLL